MLNLYTECSHTIILRSMCEEGWSTITLVLLTCLGFQSAASAWLLSNTHSKTMRGTDPDDARDQGGGRKAIHSDVLFLLSSVFY